MSSMKEIPVSIGLYRHFKGDYFYVTQVAKRQGYNSKPGERYDIIYFNICHPEQGMFSRPLVDFLSDNDTLDFDEQGNPFGVGVAIKDRPDNVTGQIHRMERVKDLNWQISSVSTEQLIEELRRRTDSPIHELDLDGLNSNIYSKDYVIGVKHEATEEIPAGVETRSVFFDEERAFEYFNNTATPRMGVFKRVFIEL